MRLKGILFITLIFLFAFADANNNFSIKTVVIDAGHGGKDPGAIGSGKTREKDIALQVALKLGEYISKNFPDVNVVYTRKTDVFIELHERAEIANKAKADLFIAVHINSSTNPEFYGTSTYVLGLHRSEANLEVAKRENAVILLEDDRDKNYEFDPNSPEGHIIMSMKQNAFLEQSIDIASKIENQFENHAHRKSMGVKQAGFYVLYKTAMPSLLAEIGFISNPEEEKYLNSEKGQDQIASSLFNAFKKYKTEMEGGDGKGAGESTVTPEPVKVEPAAEKTVAKTETKQASGSGDSKKPEPEKTVVDENMYASLKDGRTIRRPTENASGGGKLPTKAETTSMPVKKEEPKPVAENKPVVKEEPKPVVEKKPEPVAEKKPEPVVEKKPEPKPVPEKKPEPVAEKKPEPKKEPVIEKKPEPVAEKKPEPKKEPEVKKPEPVADVPADNGSRLVPLHKAENGVLFKVQMFALKGELKEYAKAIKVSKTLSCEELSNGLTRYYAGNVKSYAEAKRILELAKSAGFKEAYIVGYKDGARMNAEQIKQYE